MTLTLAALVWTVAPSPAQPETSALAHQPTEWHIVIDDLHLSFTDTGRVRALLSAMIGEALAHGEPVGLRATGPSVVTLHPTTDASALRLSVTSATGNGLKDVDMLRASDRSTDLAGSEPALRTRTALRVIQSAIDDVSPGIVVLIVVTNGLTGNDAAMSAAFDAITATARQRDVRIIAADPRDPTRIVPPPPPDLAAALANLHASEAASLDRLATGTGGAVARGLAESRVAMAALRR